MTRATDGIDEPVGVGAATEAPAIAMPVDVGAVVAEELTRLHVLLVDERAARVAAEEEREALAAALRERSAQLDAARRDLEVSRALRRTQADTIRRLSAELDAARPDRVRRERQNTRRRVERVCAAMAKHLARRASR